ncbi:sucrose synthase [Tanacetum coccineum]
MVLRSDHEKEDEVEKCIQEKYTWKIYSERLLTLANVYGFWKHVSKLDRLEIKRYLKMLYALKYRKLAEYVPLANVYDAIVAKTKQWDKLKLNFDAKVASLDQELMRYAAENATVLRSLQQRSNMLIKIEIQCPAWMELLLLN